jgi:hypothetical protein
MINRAKSMKPSQWRNPNNLHFEALRCIVALQACKPSVATPFREEIVNCLRSTDPSLRYLAADVLYNSCSADNLSSVAEQVRLHLCPASLVLPTARRLHKSHCASRAPCLSHPIYRCVELLRCMHASIARYMRVCILCRVSSRE